MSATIFFPFGICWIEKWRKNVLHHCIATMRDAKANHSVGVDTIFTNRKQFVTNITSENYRDIIHSMIQIMASHSVCKGGRLCHIVTDYTIKLSCKGISSLFYKLILILPGTIYTTLSPTIFLMFPFCHKTI